MAIRILSSENITGNLTLSGNQTTGGDLYVTGTSNSNVVISRDNMYVDVGQLYIGADGASTDDTFRQRVTSGSYFIESRKSGTWTNRLQINTAGTLIVQQGMAISGNIDGVGATFIGTAASGAALVTIENNSGSTATSYGLLVKGGGNSSSGKTFEVRDDDGNTDLIVKGNGNVGIGTDSPNEQFTVGGSGTQGRIGLNTTGVDHPYIQMTQFGSPNTNVTVRIDAGGDSYFNGGNVGIGTPSPGTKLELYGDTSSGGYGVYPALTIRNDNTSGFSAVHFNQSTNQKARIEVSNSGGSMGLYTTSAASGILINSSGNVGIGTTTINNPFASVVALQVGNTSVSGNDSLITIASGTVGSGDIYFADGTSGGSQYKGFISYKHNGDYLAFGTNESTRMIINANGTIYSYNINNNTWYGNDAGLGLITSTGANNVMLGYKAGESITTGSRNTIIGSGAAKLLTASNSQYSVVIGYNALTSATNDSNSNVVIGDNALGASSGAAGVVAIGQAAANSLTGNANTVIGYGAYYGATNGTSGVIIGYQAGNAANAIGLVLIGWRAGYVNQANSNVFIGQEAGRNNTSGGSNVFIGVDAGYANVTGQSNTFVGTQAGTYQTGLYNTGIGHVALFGASGQSNASYNTALGYRAGNSITSGAQNTLLGRGAGGALTTGAYNVAIGNLALHNDNGSNHNIAIGRASMQSASGGNNVGVGTDTLEVASGSNNTAIGYRTQISTSTGGKNVSVGHESLFSNTTGFNNTAIGTSAGSNITSGNNNTCLGYDADTPSNSTTNTVVLGNTVVQSLRCQVALTVVSDKRDKTNFDKIPHGLDFVDKLKPTSFEFKKEGRRDAKESDGIKRYGFIAQDILELEGNDSVIIDNSHEDKLTYTESNLIPVLVKAIQELKAEIELLKNK